jgi:hypothetical protein
MAKLHHPTDLPSWKGLSFLPDKRVRKADNWGDPIRVSRTFALLTYLKNNPHPTIVPILDCHQTSSREYSYDMPLLAYLSDSEYKLINLLSLGSEASRKQSIKEIISLEKKHPKLTQVVKKINSWKTYLDLHGGNVMRDRYGNYKLIDIEGFGLSVHSHHAIIDSILRRR